MKTLIAYSCLFFLTKHWGLLVWCWENIWRSADRYCIKSCHFLSRQPLIPGIVGFITIIPYRNLSKLSILVQFYISPCCKFLRWRGWPTIPKSWRHKETNAWKPVLQLLRTSVARFDPEKFIVYRSKKTINKLMINMILKLKSEFRFAYLRGDG